ncbi:MAG TPA: HAD-IA family hydrolase [Acidimicrobiia bacterium]|nr:HAD-IA family hydrolase [Acidimicrobiia bacterium]
MAAHEQRDGPGVVLFDLDNTLADREAAFRRWAEHFAAEHELDGSCVQFLCMSDGDGYVPRDELFGAIRNRYGLTPAVEELVDRYRAEYPRHFQPASDVRGALMRLRENGWKIGIVTNGPPSQNDKIASLGLGDLIDGSCVSADVSVEKPDRRIFELAAAHCGGPLSGWMVGDSADTDIAGGQAAGLRTIWVSHGRTWDRPDYAPDAVVATIAEAAARITGRR